MKSTHFSTPKRFDSLEGGCRATGGPGGITGCFSAYGNNPSFQGFSDQSGLEINQTKSQAFFGANEQNKALLLNHLGVTEGSLKMTSKVCLYLLLDSINHCVNL